MTSKQSDLDLVCPPTPGAPPPARAESKAGDRWMFDRAESLVRGVNDRFRAGRKAAPSCCDIDIPTTALDKALAPLRAALKPASVSRPTSGKSDRGRQ